MADEKDRRSFERIEIPGMKAVLVNNYFYYLFSFRLIFNLLEIILKKTPLKNISVTGACIVTNQNFSPGDNIQMIISVPGVSKIPVTGNVRWTSSAEEKNTYLAGIQFLAFNKGKRYDYYKRLKKIHELIPQPATASEKN